MLRKLLILTFIFFVSVRSEGSSLEQVSDDELINLFKSESYVVVLFTKKDCMKCDELEESLVNVREDIVEHIGAWVVKAISSQMVKLYSPSKEPAIVFFRYGVPLLYDGKANEDLIVDTFVKNKEPTVRELTDDNFESLTQAATGATTGDWFVMFYSNECIDCQRMMARWEAVGAKLKHKMNVAIVNRHTSGRATARRFRISQVPYFLFFRLGKMYHYNIPKYDVTTFVAFASGSYKNAKSEKVPIPKAPFDDLTLLIADYVRDNPWLWKLFFVCFTLGILITVVSRVQESKKRAAEVKAKQEKKEKSEKEKSKKSK